MAAHIRVEDLDWFLSGGCRDPYAGCVNRTHARSRRKEAATAEGNIALTFQCGTPMK
jgi:hypothetical protein